MARVIPVVIIVGLSLVGGCGSASGNAQYMTPERLENGLVVILPGIEGESRFNRDIRRGLVMAGVQRAIPIYNWGRPIPGLGMLLNQMDFIGNRLAGVRIAKMIEGYQDKHPGRPVFVVGHSGGGGVAVFTAEAMSKGRQVDGLVLLSASIWAGYDLTKALGKCRNGIVNFHNPNDVGLLAIGTTLASNVDGMRGPSAGLDGFDLPKPGDAPSKLAAYRKLYQVTIVGSGDPHTVATKPGYVSTHVSPWILAGFWPGGPVGLAPALPRWTQLAKAFDPRPGQ